MKQWIKIWTVAAMCLFGMGQANADILSIYGAGKLDQVSGTGDVFENLSPGLAGGVEGGIEFIGLDLWGEAIWLSGGQAMYTGNFGFDFSFGSDLRLNLGLYTGPVLFQMGDTDTDSSLNLSSDLQNELQMYGVDYSDIQSQYDEAFGAEASEVESLAFGWNLARARIQVEYELFPFGYLGVGGQYAYHYTLSGEDVTSTVKSRAIDEAFSGPEFDSLPAEQKAQLIATAKSELNAEETDSSELSGTNFNVGAYLKIEFGL